MKAGKVVMEIPLSAKAHVAEMRKIGDLLEQFKLALVDEGFGNVEVSETVASRSGRE